MYDLLMKRRSIRKFKNMRVKKETIEEIISIALTAPSGYNLKPYIIIPVEDRETIAKLSSSRGKYTSFIKNAPLVFAIIFEEDKSISSLSDASILTNTIQLAGESLGLGSCWVHALNRFLDGGISVEDNIKSILNIPSQYRVLCLLPMGYPGEEKPCHRKEDLDYEKIHYESFK